MVEIKKYTSNSKKDHYKVVIFLLNDIKIIGTLHLPVGGRLTDYLNQKGLSAKEEKFVPLTDASIYKQKEEKVLYNTSFMSINKEHISFLFPTD